MGSDAPVVIIGAGPAGLAAAYESIRLGMRPVLLEKSDKVGGISRTETYKGYYFDVGGHRFFSKHAQVSGLWQQMMGEDFLKVSRKSRIYYKGRFFDYPLRPLNALSNLGIFESFRIVSSYLKSQLWPYTEEKTFEQWVSNRFGKRLYEIFFKTYTEKVWGISCKQIKADWAAQRIKSLSLATAVLNSLFGIQKTKTLIDEFNYPSKGPGMMWQRFQEKVKAGGGTVLLNSKVLGLNHENGRITFVNFVKGEKRLQIPVEHCISSAPITDLVSMLDPKAPEEVLEAARNLSYRAFFIVVFIIDKPSLFSDQWIYIHNPNVRVGRIQNFKNWSASMVADPNKTSIGMEYFCNEGDDLWIVPDSELAQMASHELSELGLVDTGDIVDHCVIRQPKAYPVYDQNYQMHLSVLRNYLKTFINLQTVGRNGMHRYNNMDHSMLTGMMATRNIVFDSHDLWTVNEEEQYLEEQKALTMFKQMIPEKLLRGVFARMDKLGFALAVGLVCALNILLATIYLTIRKVPPGMPDLGFLVEYFAGYSVTVKGAFIASAYTFFWGFLFGWLFAYLRNFFIAIYLFYVRKKTEMLTIQDFMKFFGSP